MTYLQLVNDVLARLRESQVSSVTSTDYSQLIGRFVNDAKLSVENAWNWDSLSTTITVTCIAGTSTYTVTGSGVRHKGATINNTSHPMTMQNVPIQWIIDRQQLTPGQTGNPSYYAWNGTNGTDSKIEVWPTPSGADVLKVNLYVPQVPLSADADVITVPYEAVVAGAYARALLERGEDNGLTSSEGYMLYRNILADQIAIESTRFVENECWSAN